MNAVAAFSKAHASTYDDQWKKLAPIMNGMHFLMRILLKDLPDDAHILSVGAGTGAEIMALAEAFPRWRFTAVEPAGAMLNEFRLKAEKAGITSRCTFHEGFLNTLPETNKFDAATAILVSQFMFLKENRINFFEEIYERLKPGAFLISADLATPENDELYENLKDFWARALMFADFSEEKARAATSGWKVSVSVIKPIEISSLIAEAGFLSPTVFYQSLFIHAWYSRRPE